MRKLFITHMLLVMSLVALNAQSTSQLKGINLSFKSNCEFLALHNTGEYWMLKSDYIDFEAYKISKVADNQLNEKIKAKISEKRFQEVQKGTIVRTKEQFGLFYFLQKKNSDYGHAWGIVSDKQADISVFIKIKFDNRKKHEVVQIIESIYKGKKRPPKNMVDLKKGKQSNKSEVAQPVVYKPENKEPVRPEANHKPKPEKKPKADSKPVPKVDVPTLPEKTIQKHPEVNHPKLMKLNGAQKEEFVRTHNKYRNEVGVPPLTWDDDLANYAAEWAVLKGKEGCNMQHRSRTSYGENLFWTTNKYFTPSNAVNSWGSEKNDYHGEVVGQSDAVVGHYTQMVWKTTKKVGCAVFKCSNSILVVCNYDPAGNFVGRHPYK